MRAIIVITVLAMGVALVSAQITPRPPPPVPLPPAAGCNNGRGCKAKGDVEAQCLAGDRTKPSVCKCSPGYTGAECISAADQSGKIIKDEEKFQDDLKRQLFLQDQKTRCTTDAAPFLCPKASPSAAVEKASKLLRLNNTLTDAIKIVDLAKARFASQRCKDCTDPADPCKKLRTPLLTCSGPSQFNPPLPGTPQIPDSDACCSAFRTYARNSPAQKEIQRIKDEIAAVQAAPAPPEPANLLNSANQDKCVASIAMCFVTGSSSALIADMEKQQTFCEASGQKYCKLMGCVAKNAPCVPDAACPAAQPVRCPIFGKSDGSSPCVAIGASCPTASADITQKACTASNTFPCPSGLSCAPGPAGTREFYKQCMGTEKSPMTSTWNGCPPQMVTCPGRPFVCAPLNGTRTVQQVCDAKPGAFFCPENRIFCGYEREKGKLPSRELKPICLPSSSAFVNRCPRADIKPLPKNLTYGLPTASIATQTIEGALPDGTAGRLIAKFGVDRQNLASNVPAFFTGDGSNADISVSFTVGPVADSVAQFGAFADAVDSGRLLSPIVSITPSEPVSINPDVTEKGLGLFLSIPLNDQGDPTDGSRSLSNQTNCDAAVQNLAVYSIDHEADDSADAAGGCIGELIPSGTGSGAIQLCSCKFLVPHFSAFAVVDTSPSNSVSPSNTQSSSSDIALSVALLSAAAFMTL